METTTYSPALAADISRARSWRDTLTASYELQQARLRVTLDGSAEPEEYV